MDEITWQQRIADLRTAGMTLGEIATAIGMSTSGVSDVATGRSKAPRYEAAVKLLELHSEWRASFMTDRLPDVRSASLLATSKSE